MPKDKDKATGGAANKHGSANSSGSAAISPPNFKLALNEEELKRLRSEVPKNSVAVIYFYSDACVNCKESGPQVEQVARQNPTVHFIKCDAISCMETTIEEFDVHITPTVIIIRDGKKIDTVKRPYDANLNSAMQRATSS